MTAARGNTKLLQKRGGATPKQQAYLDFIAQYLALHREAPAETDMVEFFHVSPPSVHRMVVTLADKGLISRTPGQARSIRLVESDRADEPAPASRPFDDITEPLDPPIAPLVHALRADPLVLTKGSCWGHGKKPAYIDLAVEGLPGLAHFVERLNRIDHKVRAEALFDVHLNWSEEVITSCAFDFFPNWVMLSWSIAGTGRGRAPSAALLEKIARLDGRQR